MAALSAVAPVRSFTHSASRPPLRTPPRTSSTNCHRGVSKGEDIFSSPFFTARFSQPSRGGSSVGRMDHGAPGDGGIGEGGDTRAAGAGGRTAVRRECARGAHNRVGLVGGTLFRKSASAARPFARHAKLDAARREPRFSVPHTRGEAIARCLVCARSTGGAVCARTGHRHTKREPSQSAAAK
jgi:hypothetical protein